MHATRRRWLVALLYLGTALTIGAAPLAACDRCGSTSRGPTASASWSRWRWPRGYPTPSRAPWPHAPTLYSGAVWMTSAGARAAASGCACSAPPTPRHRSDARPCWFPGPTGRTAGRSSGRASSTGSGPAPVASSPVGFGRESTGWRSCPPMMWRWRGGNGLGRERLALDDGRGRPGAHDAGGIPGVLYGAPRRRRAGSRATRCRRPAPPVGAGAPGARSPRPRATLLANVHRAAAARLRPSLAGRWRVEVELLESKELPLPVTARKISGELDRSPCRWLRMQPPAHRLQSMWGPRRSTSFLGLPTRIDGGPGEHRGHRCAHHSGSQRGSRPRSRDRYRSSGRFGWRLVPEQPSGPGPRQDRARAASGLAAGRTLPAESRGVSSFTPTRQASLYALALVDLTTAGILAGASALPRGARAVPSTAPEPLSRRLEVARLRAHFDSVDAELRHATALQLTPSQRAARATLIGWLREYRDAGRFPRNDRFPALAMPFFRDGHGALCAMAYLIDLSGRGDLVDRIAMTRNYAFIAELATIRRCACGSIAPGSR